MVRCSVLSEAVHGSRGGHFKTYVSAGTHCPAQYKGERGISGIVYVLAFGAINIYVQPICCLPSILTNLVMCFGHIKFYIYIFHFAKNKARLLIK